MAGRLSLDRRATNVGPARTSDDVEAPTVGYVLSRFPHFSETFIVREMSAVEECGLRVVPCALLHQRQVAVHRQSQSWLPRVRRTGLAQGLIGTNLRAWWRQPGTCWALWRDALLGNRSSLGFLVRTAVVLPKAFLIADMLQRAGATHVHAHYATHPALAAWAVHRLTGLPFSVTVHAHDLFTTSPMLREKLVSAKFVVAISDFNRARIAQQAGADVAARTQVVRCGVDPSRYAWPRASHPTGAPFRLMCTGSLQHYKGHVHLIDACALLRDAGLDLSCTIVGEGRLRVELEDRIRRRGLQGIVRLAGIRSEQEVAELLADADCYVQPSVIAPDGQMEGIPVALMEAMAAGVPVVATALSGVPELVLDGRTGRLVPAADATALADAVLAVAHDQAAAARLARAARQHVREQFDVHSNARALAALFSRTRTPSRPKEISA